MEVIPLRNSNSVAGKTETETEVFRGHRESCFLGPQGAFLAPSQFARRSPTVQEEAFGLGSKPPETPRKDLLS